MIGNRLQKINDNLLPNFYSIILLNAHDNVHWYAIVGISCHEFEPINMIVDSYSKWIRKKFINFFINEKFKQLFYFLTGILPNYVPHEIFKEFWKNTHFENMTAGFLLRCQNSLRWNTPKQRHFQEWNFWFSPTLPHFTW